MEIVILGATGKTGGQLLIQALARGHNVIAVARDPKKVTAAAGLEVVQADVLKPGSLLQAIGAGRRVISALGVSEGGKGGVLHAGATELLATQPQHVIWMGAVGTGASAKEAGWLTRTLLSLMGDRLKDKVAADTAILSARATVFHAGPLTNKPMSSTRRTVALREMPKRFFPASISRASVAALMLDEIESPRFAGGIAVPLEQ